MRGTRLKRRDGETRPRTVWLGTGARAAINRLPRVKHVLWLFWNARLARYLKYVGHCWREIPEQAGVAGVRLHDLRHTFASHAAMNKETLPMIGRLLGHREPAFDGALCAS